MVRQLMKRFSLRLFSLLLTAAVFMLGLNPGFQANAVTTAPAENAALQNETHWAQNAIDKWVQAGIMTGYPDGGFYPDRSITRAEFVSLIDRVFNFTDRSESSFKDVAKGSWYEEAISKAVKAGILLGDGKGYIHPEARISRQEAAVILSRAFKLKADSTDAASKFADASAIESWAKEAVSVLTARGTITGRPNNLFEPKADITRAETLVLLDRLAEKIIMSKNIYTEHIDGNLIVNVADVTLKDMTIEGDLYLAQGIGNGDLTLDHVVVKGRTVVLGGGENSINIINSSLQGNLVVIKMDGKVRVVAKGSSSIPNVYAESGVRLQDETESGNGFGSVYVMQEIEPGQMITLDGDFDLVSLEAPGVAVQVTDGIIGNLVLSSEAVHSEIVIGGPASVQTLNVNSPVNISGEGSIDLAILNVANVSIQQQPSFIELGSGIIYQTDSQGNLISEEETWEEESDPPTPQAPKAITGIGTRSTILQLGETESRTAATAEGGTITWTSSDPTVAAIHSATGVVTALKAGTATISYKSSDGMENSIPVTVYAAAAIQSPTIGTVKALESDITPTGFTAPGIGETIEWSSSDPAKALVGNSTGLIHALSEGNSVISYKTIETATGRTVAKGSTMISVLPADPGAVITGIGTAASVLQIGETETRTAATIQAGPITWSSDDPTVASINPSTGTVTALNAGTAVIRYRSGSGRENNITITVHAAAAVQDPIIGPVKVLEADVTPTGFTAPVAGETIEWNSIDPAKASVDPASGLIHAVEAGNTLISYKINDTASGKVTNKGSKLVPVLLADPGAVITGIGTASTVLQLGEMESRTASTLQGGTITWSTDDPTIAAINPASGVVTALKAGSAIISYRSSDGRENHIPVTVYAAAAVQNPTVGTVKVLENDVTPTGFTAPGIGEMMLWNSSDPAKATVDPALGLIHAIAAGNTVIGYRTMETTTGRIISKGSTLISVLPANPGAVITGIGTAATVLQVGETTSRTAATTQVGTITWSSSDPSIASVNPSTGVVTALQAGTAMISYQSSIGRVNQIMITVYAAPTIQNPVIGTVQLLESDVAPTGYTAPDIGETILWNSSDPAKATVDPTSGQVHAVTAGTTTISYAVTETATGKIVSKGSATITVQTPVPELAGLTVSAGADAGETQILSASFAGATAFKYKVQAAAGVRPYIGMNEPAGFNLVNIYGDLAASAGDHLIVIGLDASGKVVAMTDHVLGADEVASAPIHIYIADYFNNRIARALSSGGLFTPIVPVADILPYSGPMAITVAGDKVYWAQQDSMTIQRANLDGSAIEMVALTGTSNVSAIAVDPVNNRIYWADYSVNSIKSCTIKGADMRDDIMNADDTAGISNKGPVALAISGQKLYWAGDTSGKIESANLDGTGRMTLVTTGAAPQSISSLAADAGTGRIFWNDYFGNSIKSANLSDGSNITTVVSAADPGLPFAGVTYIAVKNYRIYWMCESDGAIRRAVINGAAQELITVPAGQNSFNGMAVQ